MLRKVLDNFYSAFIFALIGLFVAVSAFISFTLPSSIFRTRLKSTLRYIVAAGIMIGLLLPWDVGVGLAFASAVAAAVFVVSAFAVVVAEAPFGIMKRSWIRRELLRDILVYISIITGIVGIITTLISLAAPLILGISMSIEVPLAFDTISVSAAFLESMIPVTSYRKIYSLAYLYLSEGAGKGTLKINEKDFEGVLAGTSFTTFELRDALESLVSEGACKKVVSNKGLTFDFSERCLDYMRVCLEETRIKIGFGADKYEEQLEDILGKYQRSTVKDNMGLLKRIDKLERELVSYIEENARFEETLFLKLKLNTLQEYKKSLLSEEF
jgi:hypothetical protein